MVLKRNEQHTHKHTQTVSVSFFLLSPSECLNHEAVHLVSKSCYSKQKCVVAVSNRTFRDPCFPGTRKYLSVVYSCGASLSSSSFTQDTNTSLALNQWITKYRNKLTPHVLFEPN